MGYSTTASDYASVTIGQYNFQGAVVTASATGFNKDNAAFVIGNGSGSGTRSDAFKVMFNGDATVSRNLTVYNDLTVDGDVVVQGKLTINGQDLTGAHVTQLLNLLTQLARLTDINCISNTTDALKAAYQQHSDTCP